VNGEQLEFLLREKIDRAPHQQTPAETARAQREKKRWPSAGEIRPWWLPQWDYSASGKLMLELEERHHSGLRRVFRDGKRQRLEDLLNDFIAAAVAYAVAQKARREEHERWQRERQEQERRNIELKQQIERNKRRWEFLSDRIEALERAEKIDQFLHHLRSGPWQTEQLGAHVRELIAWAERYAANMRGACTAEQIDQALLDTELFKPPT
jgi:hypothetical protein